MKIVFYFFLAMNVVFFLVQSMSGNSKGVHVNLKPPAGVKELRLVDENSRAKKRSEMDIKLSKLQEGDDDSKKPAPPPKSDPKPKTTASLGAGAVCYSLGPFEGQNQVRSISAKLTDLGALANDRSEKLRVPIGYWVYLPKYDSWNEARRKVMELEEKGLKDIFIMGRGRMKNAVSLGLYKEEKGATDRMKLVRSLGVDPKLETQYTVDERYWIDIDVAAGRKQVISAIEAIAKGLTILDLVPRKCG